MKKRIGFEYKGKEINLEVKKLSLFGRFVGLMFKSRKKAQALLFEFGKPVKISIHSLFVFFDFFAIWLDNKNKVIDVKRVKPFTFYIAPKKEFARLIEIPINSRYKGIIRSLVGD